MIARTALIPAFNVLQVVQPKFEKPLPLLDLVPRLGHEFVNVGNP